MNAAGWPVLMLPEPGTPEVGGPSAPRGSSIEPMSRLGRLLDVVLPILASIVLVVVWVYVVLAMFTDSTLPAETWGWLEGLDLVPAVVAWISHCCRWASSSGRGRRTSSRSGSGWSWSGLPVGPSSPGRARCVPSYASAGVSRPCELGRSAGER